MIITSLTELHLPQPALGIWHILNPRFSHGPMGWVLPGTSRSRDRYTVSRKASMSPGGWAARFKLRCWFLSVDSRGEAGATSGAGTLCCQPPPLPETCWDTMDHMRASPGCPACCQPCELPGWPAVSHDARGRGHRFPSVSSPRWYLFLKPRLQSYGVGSAGGMSTDKGA